MLYEMLTGKPAFRKATSADTMSAILNDDPPALSQAAPSVPPGLQRIVNRCVAKSPDKRFQHASDLEFTLEALSDASGSTISGVHEALPTKRWIWLAAAAVVTIAIAAALVVWWRQPPGVPVVEAVAQLTDDGETKVGAWDNLHTDGFRIYYNQGPIGGSEIAQVAVTGGSAAVIPTRFAVLRLVGVNPEKSLLLVLVGSSIGTAEPLWTIPLPTGEPRRLGNIEALDASFTPDGRILFSVGKDLFIAESDGSNPRKLISEDGEIGEPRMSPDSQHLVFTVHLQDPNYIVVANADGSDPHSIVLESERRHVCCADGPRMGDT